MVGVVVCDLVNAWSVIIDGTVSFNASIAIYEVGPFGSLINVSGRCEMGDIFVPNQGDYRWGGVLDLDRPCNWHRRVSTAVSMCVGDQIDSRNL